MVLKHPILVRGSLASSIKSGLMQDSTHTVAAAQETRQTPEKTYKKEIMNQLTMK